MVGSHNCKSIYQVNVLYRKYIDQSIIFGRLDVQLCLIWDDFIEFITITVSIEKLFI